MTDTAASHIQIRPDPVTRGWLADRAGRMHETPSLQAKTELTLWRSVLEAELRRIRLTLPQALCIADVMAGSALTPAISLGVGTVYAQCYDAFRIARTRGPELAVSDLGVQDRALAGGSDDLPSCGELSSYGAKHAISEQELLDYLGSLGPAADHALANAISCWWDQGLMATAGGFAVTGLKVSEPAGART